MQMFICQWFYLKFINHFVLLFISRCWSFIKQRLTQRIWRRVETWRLVSNYSIGNCMGPIFLQRDLLQNLLFVGWLALCRFWLITLLSLQRDLLQMSCERNSSRPSWSKWALSDSGSSLPHCKWNYSGYGIPLVQENCSQRNFYPYYNRCEKCWGMKFTFDVIIVVFPFLPISFPLFPFPVSSSFCILYAPSSFLFKKDPIFPAARNPIPINKISWNSSPCNRFFPIPSDERHKNPHSQWWKT